MINEIRRMQQLAGIKPLNEVTIKSKFKLPEGWIENEIDEDWANDEIWEGKLVKDFSAPMEGWDEQHNDNIYVIKTPENKYKIQTAYAYGNNIEEEEQYNNISQALSKVYEIMEEIKADWDEDAENAYFEDDDLED